MHRPPSRRQSHPSTEHRLGAEKIISASRIWWHGPRGEPPRRAAAARTETLRRLRAGPIDNPHRTSCYHSRSVGPHPSANGALFLSPAQRAGYASPKITCCLKGRDKLTPPCPNPHRVLVPGNVNAQTPFHQHEPPSLSSHTLPASERDNISPFSNAIGPAQWPKPKPPSREFPSSR